MISGLNRLYNNLNDIYDNDIEFKSKILIIEKSIASVLESQDMELNAQRLSRINGICTGNGFQEVFTEDLSVSSNVEKITKELKDNLLENYKESGDIWNSIKDIAKQEEEKYNQNYDNQKFMQNLMASINKRMVEKETSKDLKIEQNSDSFDTKALFDKIAKDTEQYKKEECHQDIFDEITNDENDQMFNDIMNKLTQCVRNSKTQDISETSINELDETDVNLE